MNKEAFTHYRLGIVDIDDEHWFMLGATNHINDLAKEKKESEALTEIRKLSLLLIEHFRSEEDLLEKIGFPFIMYHKQSHALILHEIERIEKSFSLHSYHNGCATHLHDMLVFHVDTMDFQYLPYYKKYMEGKNGSG